MEWVEHDDEREAISQEYGKVFRESGVTAVRTVTSLAQSASKELSRTHAMDNMWEKLKALIDRYSVDIVTSICNFKHLAGICVLPRTRWQRSGRRTCPRVDVTPEAKRGTMTHSEKSHIRRMEA